MKYFVVCVFALVAVTLAEETYSTKYDNFNAQQLVDSPRLLKNYMNCFLDEGPCTPEGTDFKHIIHDALSTECRKCTPKQKELIRTVVRGFQKQLPQDWEKLAKKEDPEGKYKESFQAFLDGH